MPSNSYHRTGARTVKTLPRRIDGVYERPLPSIARKPKVVVEEKPSQIKKSTAKPSVPSNRTYASPPAHRGPLVHRVIHEYYQTADAREVPVVYQQYMPRTVPVQHPHTPAPRTMTQAMPAPVRQMPLPTRPAPAGVSVPMKPAQYAKPVKQNKAKGVLKKLGPKDGKVRPTDIIRYAVVTFFVVMAGYLAYDTWQTNQQVQNVVRGDNASASYDSSADVANPPMANGEAYPDYKVAADQPRIIMIPSINITARMRSVGLTSGNKVDVPADASFAGWYSGAQKPGDEGASFVTGHYNGPNAGGVFDSLGQIAVGAEVKVEKGDGSILKYEVVRRDTVSAGRVDMAAALTVVDGEKEGLNIMTCAGAFTGSGFTDRLTIYTKRVN